MTATMNPATLSAALEYARRGWYVLPCRIDGVDAKGKKITKLPKRWQEISTLDVVTIQGWFAAGSVWDSVGIDTGRSGLVVVDLDVTHGHNALQIWSDLGGVTASYAVATATGGLHLYFRADPARPVKASAGEIGPGIDTRGTTGFVFAPPTTYSLGTYSVTQSADWEHLTVVPDIVADLVGDQKRGAVPPSPGSTPHAVPGPAGGMGTLRVGPGTPRYTVTESNRRITAVLNTVCRSFEGDGFNDKLATAAIELGAWVAGGRFDVSEAESMLFDVVTRVFPAGPDANDLRTISSGLKKGMSGSPYMVYTPGVDAVLPVAAGPGFTRLSRGAISNREPVLPPTLYDPAGHALFYESGVHWLFGESGSGKSWVALDAVARTLINGGTALYLDYEDSLNIVLDRLSALGVSDESICGLAYVDGHNTESNEIVANLAYVETFTISVLDGVTTSLNEFGCSGRDENDVTRWADAIPRNMTGAVLCIDHVVKSKDDRGGYAIGSQAKKSVVTGASYEVISDMPLKKGGLGRLRLVLRKDKRGGVHVPVGETAARLDFASSPDGTHMRVSPVSQAATEASPGPVDTQVLLVAQLLEQAHNSGRVNLEDGMRKLKDWITGHGHLADRAEATPMRASKQEDAIRFARGWVGMPGVADRYRLKPITSVMSNMTVSQDRGDAGDGPLENGVSPAHLGVSHDHEK